jgi:uncharacterized protein YkwD
MVITQDGHIVRNTKPDFDAAPKLDFPSRIIRWANSKRNHFYINQDEAITTILLLTITSAFLFGIYSKIDKLNELSLWILPIGTLALLVCGYYFLKFLYRFIQNVHKYYANQRNWIRYTVLVVVAVLSWHIFVNTSSVDAIVDAYNQLNFSRIAPIHINGSVVKIKNQTIDLALIFPSENITKKTQDIEFVIFRETNAQRISNGKRPLKLDEDLSRIAREHSKDMAENNFLSHVNQRGEDPTARAIRNGYNVYKELGGGLYRYGIGENIGKMPTGNVVGFGYVSNTAEAIGVALVKDWMESPGHRANILDSQFDLIGIGVVYDGSSYIATQNFK